MSKKFAHILLICTCYLTKINAQIDIGFHEYAWPDSLWSGDVQKFDLFSEQLQLMDLIMIIEFKGVMILMILVTDFQTISLQQ